MSGHQAFLVVDTVIRPLISLRRVWFVPVPRETKVSNATMLGVSSRAPSVDPSARSGKPRGRSAVRSGASSGESSRLTTQPTPGKSYASPASTEEVLSQVQSPLKRNSELYPRGDSPEPEDLNEYRTLDPSRCGSPTNEDEIVTAGEGQSLIHRRKPQRREESCVCTGVEAPNEVLPSQGRVPAVARRKHAMAVR